MVAVLMFMSDPLPLSVLVLEFLQLLESSDMPDMELLEDKTGEEAACKCFCYLLQLVLPVPPMKRAIPVLKKKYSNT